jgi:hypothetical protein
MSEYHTQQLRLAEYENLYTQAQNDNDEKDRLINRLERQNDATNEQINNLSSAYERQNEQFNAVANQLQSSIRQQEINHQQQVATVRAEHIKNLKTVGENFNNQIGKFKIQVTQQFQKERQSTKQLIKQSQQESAKMINSVRQELNSKLKDQDVKIRGIQTDVNVLQNDLKGLTNQDEQARKIAKEYFNDLKFLISYEETREDSLFKKPSYCDRLSVLQIFKNQLNIIEAKLNAGQNTLAAGQALHLYQEFSTERIKVISVHQSISEKYRQNMSAYQALLNSAENSRKIKIKGIDVSKLKYDEDKKTWTEEQHELEIDVDFWTNGKLGEFITKHKKQFDHLNKDERERNHEIDDKYIELMKEKISGETKSYLAEYEAIIKEAKELALTSNLREVLGAKTINRLNNKYGDFFEVEDKDKGFELGDAKNNYHLRVKINGIERHLILGSNINDPKSITSTLMEGNDYTGNQDVFKSALDEQKTFMNEECGLKLEFSDGKQGHSDACSESEHFIKRGMTEKNKEQLQIQSV